MLGLCYLGSQIYSNLGRFLLKNAQHPSICILHFLLGWNNVGEELEYRIKWKVLLYLEIRQTIVQEPRSHLKVMGCESWLIIQRPDREAGGDYQIYLHPFLPINLQSSRLAPDWAETVHGK